MSFFASTESIFRTHSNTVSGAVSKTAKANPSIAAFLPDPDGSFRKCAIVESRSAEARIWVNWRNTSSRAGPSRIERAHERASSGELSTQTFPTFCSPSARSLLEKLVKNSAASCGFSLAHFATSIRPTMRNSFPLAFCATNAGCARNSRDAVEASTLIQFPKTLDGRNSGSSARIRSIHAGASDGFLSVTTLAAAARTHARSLGVGIFSAIP